MKKTEKFDFAACCSLDFAFQDYIMDGGEKF
jgi:hypothetical protein